MAHSGVQLLPFQPPLGPQPFHPQLYQPQPVTIVMKEKVFSLSGDDFTVRTTDGVDICKVKGKVFSIHNKTKFTTIDGAELFTLSTKLLTVFRSFHGESPAGHNFEVKGHFKLVGTKDTVEFTNASDNRALELTVNGKWLDRRAEILIGDRTVATISRDFLNAREVFAGRQTYYVTIAAGVDISLIAAICASLDEKDKDR